MARKRKRADNDPALQQDATPFVVEINKSADEEVERILSRAKRTADSHLDAAKEKAAAEADQIVHAGGERAALERRRIMSDLSLETKKIMLKARGELVETAFAHVQARLERLRGTPEYRALLKALVVEGVAALDRSEVSVSVSAADAAMANKAFFDEVARDCGRALTAACAADLDEKAMGAVVRAADGSVLFDNTIAARMERLADELQLIVSREVFGGHEAET